MIKVTISQQNETISMVEIKGHANSNEHGKDLICAGVSSISVGILNTIEQLTPDSCELKMKEGFIKIKVIKNHPTLQIVLKTLVTQLQTIADNYKKYITIKKQEV